MTFRSRFTLAVLCIASLLPLAHSEEVAVGEEKVSLFISGAVRSGRLVFPPDENSFRLKLENNSLIEYKWDQLDNTERQRIKRMYGLEKPKTSTSGAVKTISGTRYMLDTGRVVEGIHLPLRDRDGMLAIRTATMPLILLPDKAVVMEEPVERPETDFYSAKEIYERWMQEAPPGNDDAPAHLRMAHRCAELELHDMALLHIESAILIEPRVAETNKTFRQETARLSMEQHALQLYQRLLREERGGDFFAALETLDRLNRGFPHSELKTQWDPLRARIEAGTREELDERVVRMSYTVALQLIRNKLNSKVKLDAKGNVVPVQPGKQIVTRAGDVFRGTLESTESGTSVTISDGTHVTTIQESDIGSITDVDLSVAAKEADPTLDEIKDWIRDVKRPDGLKMQIIDRIAQVLKIRKTQARDIFEQRAKESRLYKDGTLSVTKQSHAVTHEATYGIASWLRDGAKILPDPEAELNAQTSSARSTSGRSSKKSDFAGAGQFTPPPPNDEELAAEISKTDDPLKWWSVQRYDTKLAFAQAYAAEKVFTFLSDERPACRNCGGKGLLRIISATGSGETTRRCPNCKGMGFEYKVLYR